MLDIPYIPNPGKACALASYTMVANYFFPGKTFEEIGKLSSYVPGYIVWPFKFWLWMMDQGIKITDYDLIDCQAWADEGIEGLRKGVSEKEFNFYVNGTKDIEVYSEDIKKVLNHPNFTYQNQKPAWNDLVEAFNEGYVCEVTLDSRTLDHREGFSLHRVVILDVSDDFIIFHDPQREDIAKPARRESVQHFSKAWLEAVSEPEMCIYIR